MQLHPPTIDLKGITIKVFHTLTTATIALALSAGISHLSAETMSHDSMVMQSATVQNRHEGTGVLKAVNAKAGKVQISHEAIASLNWPAMTMWFILHTPLPKNLKAGDRVRFELEQSQDHKLGISKIERM